MHQVVCDGWSLGVLVDELAALYDAFSARKPSPLAPLSIQYADFAHWQRHWRSHPDMVAQLAYWREQLRDPLPVMKLALARTGRTIGRFPHGAAGDGVAGEPCGGRQTLQPSRRRHVVHGSRRRLERCCCIATLGLDDVRVATNVANRNRPGSERLIGPLVNTVILRTNLGGDPTPREVMRRVRATTLAAFAHQDLPFEELVETLER